MKKALAVFIVFIYAMTSWATINSNLGYKAGGEDFDAFPLNAVNAYMIEGSWSGELLEFEIQKVNFEIRKKPAFHVVFRNLTNGDMRDGLLFFNKDIGDYALDIIGMETTIPVSFKISITNTPPIVGCKERLATLLLEFKINDEVDTVAFTKDQCLRADEPIAGFPIGEEL